MQRCMMKWLRWSILGGLLLLGCSENKAASDKCKTSNASSDLCNECCKQNGANGYKFINNECGCLGGG